MTMAGPLWQMILLTLTNPAEAARVITGLGLGRAVLWQALLLVCAVSALVMGAFGSDSMVLPMGTVDLILSPIGYALVLGSGLVMLVFAIHYTGAALEGQAAFEDVLATIVWIEVIALCFRMAQVPLAVLGEGLLSILSAAGAVVLFWALIHFINQVHRFNSLLRATATLVLAILGLGLGMSVIIAFIGVGTGLTLPTGA